MAEAAQAEWEVEDITDSRINSETLTAEFLVKWKESGDEKWDPTWEPLDAVYKCPLLLRDLAEKKKKRLQRPKKGRASKETLEGLASFKEIPKEICSKFNDPEEFLPNGSDEVELIIREITSEQKNFLWEMIFKHDGLNCFVRKCVVCYYWPYEAALFMTQQVAMHEKLKRFEKKMALKQARKRALKLTSRELLFLMSERN